MNHVTVTPEVLEGFAATNAAIGTAVAAAGSVDAAANTAVMIPVFGLIGQEFLAAFITAQANHLLAVGNLAAVHAATAASALGGLAEFESVDAAAAARLRSVR
ncbi:type VII secretion target [Gordonia sp. DT30]|uniref:type VII secretion target n=1 Tax=unclassified Gordonia (in: high G+C Gram-positive bacteria) TaxID=2657482 RepID=UPI003CF0B1FF